jgi:hypothetical protein
MIQRSPVSYSGASVKERRYELLNGMTLPWFGVAYAPACGATWAPSFCFFFFLC